MGQMKCVERLALDSQQVLAKHSNTSASRVDSPPHFSFHSEGLQDAGFICKTTAGVKGGQWFILVNDM